MVESLEVIGRKRSAISAKKGIANETGTVSAMEADSVDEDDRPLSKWFGVLQSQPTIESNKPLLQGKVLYVYPEFMFSFKCCLYILYFQKSVTIIP